MICTLLLLLIAGCTTPEKVIISKKVIVEAPEKQDKATAKELVKKAKKLSTTETNSLLITASEYYLAENNPSSALWLAEHLLSLDQTPPEQYQLALIAAKASFLLNELSRSETLLNKSDEISKTFHITHSFEFYFAQHKLHESQNNDIAALHFYLSGAYLQKTASTQEDQQHTHYIWEKLSRLSQWQQKQLQQLGAPQVNGWVELVILANQLHEKTQATSELIAWQKAYSNHPGNDIIPLLLSPNEEIVKVNNIAVIIPLSGQQSVIGKSLQEGILAAYTSFDDTSDINLTFIDANTTDFSTLPERLLAIEAQYVIGPLLKKHVETYLSIPELSLPTLLLNVPESTLLPQQVALSMRPEDEAIQAATQLSQRKFKHPIILSHNDNASLRIANAFAKQWLNITGNTLAVTPFNQGQEMQTMIKNVLAIDDSQARINSLRVKLRETLKVEARNRRDIDMIYLVATPNQTRLLKPHIDVNISPFAKRIPVFASSRSHSFNTNSSTANDLRGLTFTEIPLLLDSQQQNKALATLNKTLWPKRNSQLQPVFAMGYDSLHLVNKLPKLQKRTYLRYSGQTGTLMLNKDNILTRSLVWGSYRNNKVTEIVME